VRGVADHREQLDELIQRYARRWSVGRMPVIDRNVLRLGTYELAFESTSPAVVINEVIELAKRLSTEDSGRYVNGVIESVRKHLADHPLGDEALGDEPLDGAADGDLAEADAQAFEPTVPDVAEPPPFDAELAEVLDAEPVDDDVLPPPDDDGDAIDLLADPTPEEPASPDDVDDLDDLEELAVDEAVADDAAGDAPSGEDLVDPGEGQQQLF
jgi:transcription antitermination protein NusB